MRRLVARYVDKNAALPTIDTNIRGGRVGR